MIEQSSEISLEFTETVDFKTAKDINNDLIDILRALQELEMRTEVGKVVKERFVEIATCKLQKLEDSRVML